MSKEILTARSIIMTYENIPAELTGYFGKLKVNNNHLAFFPFFKKKLSLLKKIKMTYVSSTYWMFFVVIFLMYLHFYFNFIFLYNLL